MSKGKSTDSKKIEDAEKKKKIKCVYSEKLAK